MAQVLFCSECNNSKRIKELNIKTIQCFIQKKIESINLWSLHAGIATISKTQTKQLFTGKFIDLNYGYCRSYHRLGNRRHVAGVGVELEAVLLFTKLHLDVG